MGCSACCGWVQVAQAGTSDRSSDGRPTTKAELDKDIFLLAGLGSVFEIHDAVGWTVLSGLSQIL